VVVGLVASLTGVQALGRPGPDTYVPRPATNLPPPRAFESGFGYERLAAGQRAAERGELAEADSAFRAAWADAATRDRAAAALSDLHRTPGFTLPVDEGSLSATSRLLGSTFTRTETPHFVILSDCPRDWTNSRGDLLERTRSQFFRVSERLALPAAPHRTKLLCVLFADHRQYQAFARAYDGLEARWVAGYYATLSNRVVFYNDATSPVYEAFRDRLQDFERRMRETRSKAEEADRLQQKDLATRLHASADDLNKQLERERSRLGERTAAHSTAKTIHEAVHLLAFNCGVQLPDRDYPFWLSEGLATAFETDRPTDAFGPDRTPGTGPRRDRFDELRRAGRLTPLAELVSISEVPDWDGDTADAMYGQAYALFTYLFRKEPAALGNYLKALSGQRPGRLTAERQLELFTEYFGDPADVARRLARSR
jgi:hypothetical protein